MHATQMSSSHVSSAGKVICVLGMHRSGTSCLTGSLEEAGLPLGNCHTWNPFNLKGNRENQDFVDLNDEVLAANGGAWDKPPPRVVWSPEHLERARQLVEQAEGKTLFGFKDPRTLLVLDGWKAACPNLQFVGIFRHPESVASSLMSRSEMPRDESFALWYRYNQALYKEYKRQAFPLLCFDESEEQFHSKLNGVIGQLGLSMPESEQRFYDGQLKSASAAAGSRLPWMTARLYRKLRKSCL
jgi:hypothetical protein